MAQRKIQGQKTRPGDIRRWMREIGPALAGRSVSGANKIRNKFFSQVAYHFFSKQEDAYFLKANGRPDEFGNTWKPLSEHRRIYRSLSGSERKRFKISPNLGGRGLLTASQDRQWRRIFGTEFARLVNFLPEDKAKERAAKKAWWTLKQQGARTKKQVLRNRDAEILIHTGRLFNSFRPSTISSREVYTPRKDQIATYQGSKIAFGTKVPYARDVNETRQLIPDQADQWVRQGTKLAINKIINDIMERVR